MDHMGKASIGSKEHSTWTQRENTAAKLLWTLSKVKVKSLSHVRLFVTPWTVAHQAPPFLGFSRQEYWSGLPFPSPGYFPIQGLNPGLLHCRQTLYRLSHQGSQGSINIWLNCSV